MQSEYDDLQDAVGKLKELLEDRHEGVWTWHESVTNRLREIVEWSREWS